MFVFSNCSGLTMHHDVWCTHKTRNTQCNAMLCSVIVACCVILVYQVISCFLFRVSYLVFRVSFVFSSFSFSFLVFFCLLFFVYFFVCFFVCVCFVLFCVQNTKPQFAILTLFKMDVFLLAKLLLLCLCLLLLLCLCLGRRVVGCLLFSHPHEHQHAPFP